MTWLGTMSWLWKLNCWLGSSEKQTKKISKRNSVLYVFVLISWKQSWFLWFGVKLDASWTYRHRPAQTGDAGATSAGLSSHLDPSLLRPRRTSQKMEHVGNLHRMKKNIYIKSTFTKWNREKNENCHKSNFPTTFSSGKSRCVRLWFLRRFVTKNEILLEDMQQLSIGATLEAYRHQTDDLGLKDF